MKNPHVNIRICQDQLELMRRGRVISLTCSKLLTSSSPSVAFGLQRGEIVRIIVRMHVRTGNNILRHARPRRSRSSGANDWGNGLSTATMSPTLRTERDTRSHFPSFVFRKMSPRFRYIQLRRSWARRYV